MFNKTHTQAFHSLLLESYVEILTEHEINCFDPEIEGKVDI